MSKIKWHNFPDELPFYPNGQAMYIRKHEVQSNKVRIVNLEIHICKLDRTLGQIAFVDKEGNEIHDVAQWAKRKERKHV